ncbi:MAG TPA: hypothetical protein PLI06_00835 [Methanofastidiosum sp.]|nr:hypothetical protein [Methanofastidiosum sp.]
MFERRIIPQANFTNADILIVLKIIEKEESIGRKLLSKRIFLNETSIRSILTKLKEMDYITSSRLGHKLTNKGKNYISKSIQFTMPVKVDAMNLTLNKQNYGSVISGVSNQIKDGMEQRDRAVFGGAKSAITLIYAKNHFYLPKIKPELEIPNIKINLNKDLENELLNKLELKDNDVVIIASSEDEENAFRGIVNVIDLFI